MKNKKQVLNEIIKLRKILSLSTATEMEKQSAWCVILTLQWLYLKRCPFGPATIVKPNLQKWELK